MAETEKKFVRLVDFVRRKIGRRVSGGTLHRWYNVGLNNGVKLKVYRVGTSVYTCEEYWQEFEAALGKPAASLLRGRTGKHVGSVAVASESTEINAFHLQMNDLIRENERLRKENATLRQTLKNVTGLLS
jgi:hypothetical protein